MRRYRAAVYARCGSVRDVDAAFDILIEMMLSDRREDFFWGALLDFEPSSLFRTFGDHEIEERARYRYERICADYGECGFFVILRGRRYCGGGNFRCEDGIYGAIRLLAGGDGNGCVLRLSTDDRASRSDRIFILDALGLRCFPLFPCDITRSSYMNGTVILSCGEYFSRPLRKRFRKELFGETSGNYRVIGWVTFPFADDVNAEIYHVYTHDARRVKARGGVGSRIGEVAIEYAGRGFLGDETLSGRFRGDVGVNSELASATLFAYVGLGAMEAIDAVNLVETLRFIVRSLPRDVRNGTRGSVGFLRIALLVASAFCDGMGEHGEEYYAVSAEMRSCAERLRVECESGDVVNAPYLPCEMLAFRICGMKKRSVFAGFTAPKRWCDRFLYLFCADRGLIDRMIVELVSEGFGENGIESGRHDDRILNALLIALCAERSRSVFSRIAVRVPELRGCRRLFDVLP